MSITPVDNCVRRTPDLYNFPEPTTPPSPPKSTGEQLLDSFNDVVVGKLESDVVGNGDTTVPNPFNPDAPELQAKGFNITIGRNGASSGSSGPSLFGSALNLGKWIFVDALPILARSEPVQTAAKAVVNFVSSAAKTVAEAVASAEKPVTEFVASAVKAVEEAATSTWNWIKSWF